MPVVKLGLTTLAGVPFSVAEIALAESLSKSGLLQLAVRLDYDCNTEEFKQVLAFKTDDNSACQWIIWRDASTFFVKAMFGFIQQYDSLAEVLEDFEPEQSVAVTDINASSWPI